jgi:hypothetical protein
VNDDENGGCMIMKMMGEWCENVWVKDPENPHQTELRADRQILLEAKHGTVALRHGLDDRLFLTAIKQKSPKFACF